MLADQKETLLSPEERSVCERVSATNDAPYSQRAQALLALDDGLSQLRAGEVASLTLGQVKYCLRQFRQRKLAMFPEHLRAQAAPAQPEPASELIPEPEQVAPAPALVQPPDAVENTVQKSKKEKKKKKGKKKKNSKKNKPQKSKKDKKGKKKSDSKKGKPKKAKKKKAKKKKKGKK